MDSSLAELLAGLTAARTHLEARLARASATQDHIWMKKPSKFSKDGPERQREDERSAAHQAANRAAADIVIRYKTALSAVSLEIERLTVSVSEQDRFDLTEQTADPGFVEDISPEPIYVRRAWQEYLDLYREHCARTRAAGGGTVKLSAKTICAMQRYIDAVDLAEHGGAVQCSPTL